MMDTFITGATKIRDTWNGSDVPLATSMEQKDKVLKVIQMTLDLLVTWH